MEKLISVNPSNQELLGETQAWDGEQVRIQLERSWKTYQTHSRRSLEKRVEIIQNIARVLRERAKEYAPELTREMGKPIAQAKAEIQKCGLLCNYYAAQAKEFLQPRKEEISGAEAEVHYAPQGIVLIIMPWNFPFWQIFRAAVPALLAGNVILLKHAPNVQRCAHLLERLFSEAQPEESLMANLPVGVEQVENIIADSRVRGVSLTGSVGAGRAVGALCGKYLKKSVLELGGSNAFIVLEDADVAKAADLAIKARMMNNGQSCIAAKRFLIHRAIMPAVKEALLQRLQKIQSGDPIDPQVDMGPLARVDLAKKLEEQVQRSVDAGAQLLCGGKRRDAFYEATLLDNVKPGMPAFDEELFGPVMALIAFDDLSEAIRLSNNSSFGLGVTLVTSQTERVKELQGEFDEGAVFVNELVKSDPRLPFGGTKDSGYGRELSREGIREFTNIKTLYIKREL